MKNRVLKITNIINPNREMYSHCPVSTWQLAFLDPMVSQLQGSQPYKIKKYIKRKTIIKRFTKVTFSTTTTTSFFTYSSPLSYKIPEKSSFSDKAKLVHVGA